MLNRVRIGVLAILASIVALSTASEAAVRVCSAAVVGEGTATIELAARKEAMTRWTDAATLIGREYTSWQLALQRNLSCERAAGQQFRCSAVGRPCTIKQVPPTGALPVEPPPTVLPAPTRPLPRL